MAQRLVGLRQELSLAGSLLRRVSNLESSVVTALPNLKQLCNKIHLNSSLCSLSQQQQ